MHTIDTYVTDTYVTYVYETKDLTLHKCIRRLSHDPTRGIWPSESESTLVVQ